jgi:hypothetical protein
LNSLNDLAHCDAWVDVRAVTEREGADGHGQLGLVEAVKPPSYQRPSPVSWKQKTPRP